MIGPLQSWTAEEEAIFLEVIEKLCATQLWAEIKKDGRLEYRGSPGIRAHYLAFVSRVGFMHVS